MVPHGTSHLDLKGDATEQVGCCASAYLTVHSPGSVSPLFLTLGGISQNHRMLGFGKDLKRSSSSILLPEQEHLEEVAQEGIQMGFDFHAGCYAVCGVSSQAQESCKKVFSNFIQSTHQRAPMFSILNLFYLT